MGWRAKPASRENGHHNALKGANVEKRFICKLLIYRSGDRRAVVFYAAAIRHIYVHGHLTAHPNKYAAVDLESICAKLSSFILDLIREDFDRRIAIARGSGKSRS